MTIDVAKIQSIKDLCQMFWAQSLTIMRLPFASMHFAYAGIYWMRLHRLIRFLVQRDGSNPLFGKAEGTLSFYLEGKRSLVEQEWSNRLTSNKQKWLDTNGYFNGIV